MLPEEFYNPKVFDEYRLIRNAARKYVLEDSLATIRAYSQHLASQIPFPSDLEPSAYLQDMSRGIKQWELLIIAREMLIHSHEVGLGKSTLRRAHDMDMLVSKLRRFEDNLSGLYVSQDNVLWELNRIAHRQFMWNSGMPDQELLLRYYKIFGSSQMEPIFQDKIGINLKSIYIAGLAISGSFLSQFALNYPPSIETSKRFPLTQSELDVFYNHFSVDLHDLRNRLANENKKHMNDTFPYFLDSLVMNPMIRMEVQGKFSIVSPLPTLLIWRFTRGIYYELYDHPNFADAFGSSFQNYVGELLIDVFSKPKHKYTILPEEPTANDRGVASSDHFLSIDKWVLLIEAKTKRMGINAKMILQSDAAVVKELEKLADGVVQLYRCIESIQKDLLAGKDYRKLKGKVYVPFLVTLEDWHIFGPTWEKLLEIVKSKCKTRNIPVKLINDYPFAVGSINDLENLTRAIKKAGSIGKIFDERIRNSEYQRYEIYTYLFNQKKKYVDSKSELFKGEFKDIFGF